MRIPRSSRCLTAALVMGSSLAGCVSRDVFPEYWPALVPVPTSACADIAGRYRNEAVQTGQCFAGSGAYEAQWDCDVRLNWLLGEPEIGGDTQWVEVRQPDPDRIEVTTEVETRMLRRSAGDFDCDEEGVEVSQHASAVSEKSSSTGANVYMSTILLMAASGGVNALTLHFRPAADGSLVAKLAESSSGLVLAIPYHRSSVHYLRWARWTEDTPTGTAGTVVPDR